MRRVQRDATKEEFIQQLCDSKTGHFSEIWRLLLFAALLGKAKGKREPLKQVDGSKSFPAAYFSASPIWPGIIHLLALAEGGGPDSLKAENWDESLRVFEEYANGGLSVLNSDTFRSDDCQVLPVILAQYMMSEKGLQDVSEIRI